MERWQAFLVILLFLFMSSALNTFGIRILPAVDQFSLYWSVSGMLVVMIVLLACGKGDYQDAKFVFATFTNATGVSTVEKKKV